MRDFKKKLQTVEDIVDSQAAEIIELKHNTNTNNDNSNTNNTNNSPTKRNKNKSKNNSNINDNDLLNEARRALSASPSNISRENSFKTNKNAAVKETDSINIDITDDINKLVKNPIALKPTPRIVKEVGVNETRLEQLLKQNNEHSKWSEYKKHDRLFQTREILKGRIKSNDENDNKDLLLYNDIEEKDIEKYKPPLPPNNKYKNDDENGSRVKSIFHKASDVIKNGLSVRRSWDSRSPSPAGGDNNSDTRSNTSDKSNASIISKSSNRSSGSITRGRLLGGKKKNDNTIYPVVTDHIDDDLQDFSYI